MDCIFGPTSIGQQLCPPAELQAQQAHRPVQQPVPQAHLASPQGGSFYVLGNYAYMLKVPRSQAGILTSFSNSSIYPSVFVGNSNSISVTHTGHSFLHTSYKPLDLNHILVTPHIIKNLIYVRKFTYDNDISVEFDAYSFVKDYQTQKILLCCDSMGDLYPVTQQPPLQTPVVLLSFSSTTWHRRLGHAGDDVLHRLESSNLISCNKSKLPALCHACQLGKHVKLPFNNYASSVKSVFEIIHSDIWTSLIPSESASNKIIISRHVRFDEDVFPFGNITSSNKPTYDFLLPPLQTTTNVPNNEPFVQHVGEPNNPIMPHPTTPPTKPPPPDTPPSHRSTTIPTSTQTKSHAQIVASHTSIPINNSSQTVSTHLMVTRAKVGIFKPLEHEYNALITNGTWVLVPRPAKVNGVRSMWIFKHKFHTNGSLSRYKARFVASGRSQQQGIDCDKTFFRMVKPATIRTVLSLAISRDCPIHQLDVKNAFLHEEILERAHLQNCNPCKTPVDTESKLGSDGDPVSDPTLYRSLAGALHYLTFTRPDLSYRQVTLSRSSAKGEYRGVANVVAETAWIRNLLCELHTLLFTATLDYCDNVSVVYMSANSVQHQRTKHVEIDIHFVREFVDKGKVRVLHVPSRFQTSIRTAISRERRMAASILHLHFHDCFIQGCDASILLDDSPAIISEKNALPNKGSDRGYKVIEAANPRDMVALSEAHTIGQAQCFLFRDRIYANGSYIDAGFASTRRRHCPINEGNENLVALDLVTPNSFDNNYLTTTTSRIS
uniref:peroxidase n=1 Tax=Tanacetum cinerariifolium TaxID=118510 RepID=A0A6L2LWV1_TANCI|nr:ribonuclease H-like domain-containing protein [Tanacetum cinerariifolium]